MSARPSPPHPFRRPLRLSPSSREDAFSLPCPSSPILVHLDRGTVSAPDAAGHSLCLSPFWVVQPHECGGWEEKEVQKLYGVLAAYGPSAPK